uniref:peptidylprolyl isomerase n=1 Tax=Meleagris gallopavo TaxID=9103 RepID=A0A803XP67_MELGA
MGVALGLQWGWHWDQHGGGIGTKVRMVWGWYMAGTGTSMRLALGPVWGWHWDQYGAGTGSSTAQPHKSAPWRRTPQGSLEDGRVIDTSLSRDPLQVELGKRQVIPGLEQSLLDMCVG